MMRVAKSVRALNRFMQLEEGERWLIVESACYLVCARLAVGVMPPRTLLALGRLDSAQEQPADTALPPEVVPALRALETSTRRMPFANCFTRALALRMLLANRDIPTELHIGVRKDEEGRFAAHAWLTWRERILLGGEDAPELYREMVGSGHALLR